ncbi:MAG: hypothetical protein ACRCTE_04655 [Cellulosilyticaceae bacterium]
MKIKICIDEKNRQILIYDSLMLQELGRIPSLKQQDFYKYFKQKFQSIDMAIIPPIGSYRNVLYALYPKIRVVVDKETMIACFGGLHDYDACWLEVAATVDKACEEDFDEWTPEVFIRRFYQSQTRRDAMKLYYSWQINMPIQQPKLYRHIRLIAYFEIEIFNYFAK